MGHDAGEGGVRGRAGRGGGAGGQVAPGQCAQHPGAAEPGPQRGPHHHAVLPHHGHGGGGPVRTLSAGAPEPPPPRSPTPPPPLALPLAPRGPLAWSLSLGGFPACAFSHIRISPAHVCLLGCPNALSLLRAVIATCNGGVAPAGHPAPSADGAR